MNVLVYIPTNAHDILILKKKKKTKSIPGKCEILN